MRFAPLLKVQAAVILQVVEFALEGYIPGVRGSKPYIRDTQS